MMVTPTNTNSAIAAVTMMWLVTVKEYGSRPNRLQNRMNMKSENMKGKNARPSLPTFSFRRPETKSYIPSHSDCQRPGTIACLRVPSSMKAVIAATAMTIHSAELVKETSSPPMWIGPPIG